MQSDTPLILTFCDDIFFLPRIEDATRALGFRFKAFGRASELGIDGDSVKRQVHLTEPLEGPDATLIRSLVDDRPALILIDTANRSLPWQNWIHVIKTSAATRRIPIIAFGAHVDQVTLQSAGAAGADLTISRGRLQASLAKLITEWAAVPDRQAVDEACKGVLSDNARQGIELISQGEYYQAHEVLEIAWRRSEGAQSYLLRTLLQVAVSYYHIEGGNIRGARKLLLRLAQWIRPLPPVCMGVDVQALRQNLSALRAVLEESDGKVTPDALKQFLAPIPLIS